ncbi:VWA7 [Branchiostoma lanceolatum]|uniref:VWA7 protein n=1 Tax=Branchiostoma lanceolatum TaxID=7740 RepID=A0A8K0AFR6_BRALA|nr:VWA7 [Branchiostoma lanceolatum]
MESNFRDWLPSTRGDISGRNTQHITLPHQQTQKLSDSVPFENDYLTNAVYHMSGEEIQQGNTKLISLRSSILSVLRADTTNFQTARAMIGEYLHLLQDFYSNTNWVELEGDIPYEDLATTTNTGKCSHGGIRDDSRVKVATGGINKETSLPEFSPHHYLHDQAAQAALKATLNFFIASSYGLLSEVGPESFKELLGLGSGNSLVFVIDISGSMSNDLQAVKQTTVQLVNDNAGTVRAPYNYILSTFSDPGVRRSRHVKTSNFYDQLAQLSGGSVFEGDKDEIAELTDVISVYVSNSAPVLLTKVSISPGVGRIVPLQVDSTLEEFVISLIGVSSAPDVTIETPEGTSQVFGTPDAEISVDVGNNRIYQIHNPEPGTWRLLFRDSQQYMLEVTGKSSVDFTYQFVKTGNHGVTLPIEGSPVAGVNTTVMIDVIGSENIQQLHSLLLLGREGRELVSSATVQLGGRFGDKYYTSIVLPTQEFRVKVEGTDANNGTFQRVHPAFISPQSFDVSLDGEKEQLFAGGTAKVYFQIVNHGSRSTFILNATDDASMVQSLVPTSITLMENDNTTGNVMFSAPSGTAVGITCTATLSVTGPGGSFNSIVIRMTVEPQLVVTVDDVLPICTIVSTLDNCTLEQQHPSTCQNHMWSFGVEVRDEGSGIYSLQAAPVGNGTDFSHDSFTPGIAATAISAQYRSYIPGAKH